jgi:peptide/nickel transport system substrate-binding protein
MRYNSRALVTIALAVVTVGGVAGCAPAEPPPPHDITIAIGAERNTGFDPLQGAQYELDFAMQGVYDTLMKWDWGTYSLSPWLAIEWTLSEDRRSMEITLRDDAVFSDGIAVDAKSVEEYFDALFASPGYPFASVSNDQFGLKFTATGDYTLELTAEAPITTQANQQILGYTPIASPEAIKDPEALDAQPVGSGPYLLESQIAGLEYVLSKNPDFWDPDLIPYDTVTLTIMPDPIAQLNALKTGQVDATADPMPVANVAEAEASGLNVAFGFGNYSGLSVFDPSNSTEPALRDVRVREALALAFDREAINASINQGYGKITSQSFVEGQPFWVEGGDERYGYDPDRAKELLAEAGYPDGFAVVIPVMAGDPGMNPIVEQYLGDIGIEVTFEEFTEGLDLFIQSHSGKYPLIYAGGFFVYTMQNVYVDYPGLGRFHVPTPEAKELTDVILNGSADEAEKASVELGEYLLDELWDIPFSTEAKAFVSVPEVEVTVDQVYGSPSLFDYHPAD